MDESDHSVKIIRFSFEDESSVFLRSLIKCYQQVFAGSPWNEWKKCSACDKKWGIEEISPLETTFTCCGIPLVDFWPSEKVESDLRHEVTKDASCWIALGGEKVVGFCWGYPTSVQALEEKLGIPLSSSLKELFSHTGELIAYQDDMGILPSYRGKVVDGTQIKISHEFVAKRNDDFLSRGLSIGIARVQKSPQPSKTFEWYTTSKVGFQVIAEYPNPDGRVILARKLDGLSELMRSV